jgi:AAA+ superfamily predicted ATPase
MTELTQTVISEELSSIAVSAGSSKPCRGYQNSWEHLKDELLRLDLLIRLQLLKQRGRRIQSPLDQFKGLILTESEITGLLGIDEAISAKDESDSNREYQKLMEKRNRLEKEIQDRRAAYNETGVYLSLPHLSDLFQLTDFEQQCLVICLAPEVDRKYEKLYAYLQDDVTRKRPTVSLIMDLLLASAEERFLARSVFDAHSPLLRFRLLQVANESANGSGPLLTQSLKLDDRMVNFLLDKGSLDAQLEQIARLVTPAFKDTETDSGREERERTRCFLRAHFGDAPAPQQSVMIYCHGPYGSGKQAFAESIAHELGLFLIVADAAKMLNAPIAFEETLWLLGRECLLQPALLCLENFNSVTADDAGISSRIETLAKVAKSCCRLVILLGSQPWKPGQALRHSVFIELDFSTPNDGERRRLWEDLCRQGYELGEDVDLGIIASKFRFTRGQIEEALAAAQTLARLRSPGNARISLTDLHEGCRARSSQKLGALARKIQPHYSWTDIVVPDDVLDQLGEICQRVVHRHRVLGDWGFGRKLSLGKGVNALFAGPSGTGKTMAAEIVANELVLELYKIDLSGIVSKYIGETEKNLEQVFEAAEDSNAILFFDEADALFGKRSEVRDSHDRYANIEISYLLQRMEQYDGVTILATNRRGNLDEAFSRRLAFTVHFPFPDEANRRRIWAGIWPEEAPLDESVDLDLLTRRFKLSGGNIKNVALAAAFLAAQDASPITIAHVIHAVGREYQKMGKPLSLDELSAYALEEALT